MLYARSVLAVLCSLLAVTAAADLSFHQFVTKFNKVSCLCCLVVAVAVRVTLL